VHADAGYIGAEKRVKSERIEWHIAQKRGKITAMRPSPWKRAVEEVETLKARIRARVEHPFRVIKRQFGFVKVRFKGLAKNTAQVLTLFALANLWMARKQLLLMMGELRPQFGK
jgi:transposase, IS5 family